MPLALVTADSEGRILAVRLTDMRVVRSLEVPHEPHGIEAVDLLRSALVMSNESGTVTVLDAGALEVRRVLEGFSSPRYAAGTRGAGSRTSATTSPARSSPSMSRPHA